MTSALRLGLSLAGFLLAPPALWLAGDAWYARRTLRRANAPGARRAAPAPFMLHAAGRPALLLIHGFADGPAVFARIGPRLAAAGFAVRAMHLSGSGGPPAAMRGVTPAVWRADIDREIAALRAAVPDRPVWLVGHSLGGALAFDAALRSDNRVAGLVLLAPLVAVARARSPLLSPRRWFALLDRFLVLSEIVESRLPADLRDPEARAAYRTDKYIHRDIYRALFAVTDAIRPRAGDWRGPLLVLVSPSDQIVDSAATRRFFAATNAAPARLDEQPGAGHVLPLDHGHDQVADRIVHFVRAATEAPAPARADSS